MRGCAALLLSMLIGLAVCSRIDAAEGTDSAWRAYERGDYATAATLYAQAAKHGDRLAQFNYAMMLLRGEAVATERGEAVSWLRKAADAGMMQAQYNLALLYEKGTGVPRSLTATAGSSVPSRATPTPKSALRRNIFLGGAPGLRQSRALVSRSGQWWRRVPSTFGQYV
jgi:hypothetical protein